MTSRSLSLCDELLEKDWEKMPDDELWEDCIHKHALFRNRFGYIISVGRKTCSFYHQRTNHHRDLIDNTCTKNFNRIKKWIALAEEPVSEKILTMMVVGSVRAEERKEGEWNLIYYLEDKKKVRIRIDAKTKREAIAEANKLDIDIAKTWYLVDRPCFIVRAWRWLMGVLS